MSTIGFLIFFLLFPFLVIFAGVWDFFTLRISNTLNSALVVLFMICALVFRWPWEMVGAHLACGFVVFILGFALYAVGFFGGGDAKFLAASALWVGWAFLPNLLVITAISGGILALLAIYFRAQVEPFTLVLPLWLQRYCASVLRLPYGLAIACGTLVAFPDSFAALLWDYRWG